MAESVSDFTAPSSPPRADNAIFSDTLARSSSPPSSPPGFPWEQQRADECKPELKCSPSTRMTAFSVLGKRKALASTTANTRLAKKAAVHTSVSASASTKSAGGIAKPHASKPLTQLRISLGQATQRTCSECGMSWAPALADDCAVHARFHQARVAGCAVARSFLAQSARERVFPGFAQDDAVVRVDSADGAARRQLAAGVLEAVQRELGAAPLDEHEVWGSAEKRVGRRRKRERNSPAAGNGIRFWAYLYVRAGRCVGFLLAEDVREAFTTVQPADVSEVEGRVARRGEDKSGEAAKHRAKTASSALEALQARRQAAASTRAELDRRPIELSRTKIPTRLGISRIWTLAALRGQSIATTLLDTALYDAKLESKVQVAFSQPTQAGARLARKWTGMTYGWHVYT